MARWRLCNIGFTIGEKLLNFLNDEMLQTCDFLGDNIADTIKNHEMRNF